MTTKYSCSTRLLRHIFTLGLLSATTFVAAGQQKDSVAAKKIHSTEMSGVVVTGQYKPTYYENAVQRIRVIDSKKIAAMGAQNLRDVLLNETNVTISQDGVLGSSVSIQGISGQNVKILVDGVPVIGRQEGNIDLSQLNIYNVERIELIEGPMSVTYGTDAMAGTINIITKSGLKNKLEGAVNTYYETIGKYNVNANIGYTKNRHTILLSGARNFFDGWNEGESLRFFDFSKRPADFSRSVSWDPKEEYNGNLQYIYSLDKWKFRYKMDYFQDHILNRGAPRPDQYIYAFDDHYNTLRFNNTILANGSLGKNMNLNFLVAYNYYKRIKNTYNTDLTTLADNLSTPADQDTSRYNLFNSRATLSGATANDRMSYEVGYDINVETGYGERIEGGSRQIGDYAAYASMEYKVLDSLTIRPGLRYAYNTAFTTPAIPSINIRYQIARGLTLRAAYALGFRAPGVKELYFSFHDSNHDIDGNPNLNAEHGNNFNTSLAYKGNIAKLYYKLELTGFYNEIRDMITLAQIADPTAVRYTYFNLDKFKTQGLQVNMTGQYRNLSVTLGGSYIGRYNQLSEEAHSPAPQMSYTTEGRFNVSYELKKYGLTASLFLKYNGKMPGYVQVIDSATQQTVIKLSTQQEYTIADFSLAKSFAKGRVNVTLGCKNIFNVTSLNMYGAAASATSSSSPHSAGTNPLMSTGRSYFLGLGYKFSK